LIFSFATLASFPRSDEPSNATSLGVDEVERLAIYEAKRNKPIFAIVMTLVGAGHHEAIENPGNVAEINSPLVDERLTLVVVPLKFQRRLIYTKVYTFSSNELPREAAI
jgi:hypothetical protein